MHQVYLLKNQIGWFHVHFILFPYCSCFARKLIVWQFLQYSDNIVDLCCAGKHSKAGKHEKAAKPATESAISKAASTAADAITKAISRNLKKSQIVEDDESEEDDDSEDDSDEVCPQEFSVFSMRQSTVLVWASFVHF